jgi:hypothetical protein
MNSTTRWFLAAAFVATPVIAATARIERVVEKSFTIPAAGTLRVETSGGGVRVATGTDRTVKITARQKIRAADDAEADQLLKKLELTMEQNGNDVLARSRYEDRPLGFRWGSWPPVNVDFVITVPADFAADVRTSGGSITIGDLGGKIHARTSGGSLTLGKIGGPVDARTSGGSITLDEAGGSVDLETSGGSITVGRVAGKAELSTSGGGIKIESVDGALRATTSGGSIRASITGSLKEDCLLSTSGGGVRVTVDKNAAFQLDASSSGGGVDAQGITMTLDKISTSRTRLAGAVNGGGPLLKLRSSGGSVSVAAR